MITLKQRVESQAIAAGQTENLGASFRTTGANAERVTGAIKSSGDGTLRVDLQWQDEDGTEILTETGVGTSFNKPIVAPRLQVEGVETGSADPVTVDLATFMVAG